MNPVHVEAARSIKNAVENKAFIAQKLTLSLQKPEGSRAKTPRA
jgi:hypothetical protein